MAMDYSLTEGALRLIMQGGSIEDPIMQVLGSKRIASASADKERFRLLLSDGQNVVSFAMLTTQINDKIANGELTNNTIIKLKRYITSVINNAGKSNNKRVLVILEMETLISGEYVDKIGNPESLPESDCWQTDQIPVSEMPHSSSKLSIPSFPSTPSSFNNENKIVNLNQYISLEDQLTHPISSLSPYQNRWVIKARVTNKSTIRTWSNSRGEGQLFSMDLVDDSGEIRCTAFRELVDKFYEMIQVDKLYYITKCQLKIASKQFNTLKNDYEMTFTNETIVQECYEADASIPQTKYDFISINKMGHMETGTVIDAIGICKDTSDIFVFNVKSTGKELKKREITLVDQSNCSIVLTLWGSEAEKFDGTTHPVITIKGTRISEFGGGKTLSIFPTSILKINPDIPEAHRLRSWFDNGGIQQNATNISARTGMSGLQTPWLNFKKVQDLSLGHSERGDYFLAKATIMLFRSENCLYKACPNDECKRKVIDMENGMYHCIKCNRDYPRFSYRLLGSMNAGDWSGNLWISMFASEAEKVLGMTSEEVGFAAAANPDVLISIAETANFRQFMFKCRARMENYNDETRLKTVAVRVDKIDYKEYNAHLISRINQLLKEVN